MACIFLETALFLFYSIRCPKLVETSDENQASIKINLHLLLIDLSILYYKFGLLGFFTAFVFTTIIIPPFISWFKNKGILDMPGNRKEHISPVPTMGGIALVAGMMMSLFLWFPFSGNVIELCFLFSVLNLSALGI